MTSTENTSTAPVNLLEAAHPAGKKASAKVVPAKKVAGNFAGKWKAVVKRGGKTVVLADGVAAGAAYAACVEAAKKAA
jgi:hypothetical protein